jgi:hypothetical protein
VELLLLLLTEEKKLMEKHEAASHRAPRWRVYFLKNKKGNSKK